MKCKDNIFGFYFCKISNFSITVPFNIEIGPFRYAKPKHPFCKIQKFSISPFFCIICEGWATFLWIYSARFNIVFIFNELKNPTVNKDLLASLRYYDCIFFGRLSMTPSNWSF